MKRTLALTGIILSLAGNSIYAQQTDSLATKNDIEVAATDRDNSDPAKSYFSSGTNYQTDNVYLGRKDSATIPYLSPRLGYYYKSGLFAELKGNVEYFNKFNTSILSPGFA